MPTTTVGPTTLFQEDGEVKTSDFTPEGDSGAGNLVDVSKPSDLKSSSKQKLGSYLKSAVQRNYYDISDSNTPPVVSNPNSLGTPSIPNDSSSTNSSTFLSQAMEEARNRFNSLSSNDPDLAAVLDKNSQVDGHSIYQFDTESSGGAYLDPDKPDSAYSPAQEKISPKISGVLGNNRFSQGSSFKTRRQGTGNTHTLQRRFGSYNPDPGTNDELLVKNLAGIGEELIARAGSAISIATGIKVDVSNFNARNAYRGVADGNITTLLGGVPQIDGEATSLDWSGTEDANVDEEGFTRRNLKSNGSTNSPGVPFAGIGSIEMKGFALASAIGVLALSAVASGVIDLIELTVKDNLYVHNQESIERGNDLPLGQSTGRNSYGYNSLGRYFFKLIGTNNGSRSESARIFATLVGTTQFYSQVVGASQGYYLAINRNVFRDLERIERVIEQSKHMFEGDNRNFSGGAAIALGVLESINILLETLGSSQIFKFANAMANLGDICLLSGRGGFDSKGDDGPTVNLRSDILPLLGEPKNKLDTTIPNVGNIHEKSRAKFDRSSYNSTGHINGKGLAWRFGAYSSAYVAPVTATFAAKGGGAASLVTDINNSYLSNKTKNPNLGENGSKFRTATNGRIDTAVREKLEAELNASHVPFYFHDLRTNEIISFWAFLESLNDSFTPEVNSVGGFGRMDNVQIYKRTGRSISLTFMAVATNQEDFDEMWFAINKLVTLVYPQYSRGTQRENSGGGKFVMPFTQIPTASPLIRMRVGDLFTSNRNPVTERRNFGIGTESFSPTAAASQADFAALPVAISLTDQEAYKKKFTDGIRDNGVVPKLSFLISQDPVFITPNKYKVKKSIFKLKIEGDKVKGVVKSIDPLEKAKGGVLEGDWIYEVEIKEDDSNPMNKGKIILATMSQLKPDADSLSPGEQDPRLKAAATTANATDEDLNSFMNKETGVAGTLVRSFDSAGGEGLAGMITQLDFDWLLNTMLWDTSKGRRAPMGCKITISFNPIHDYQLGLTDMGEISAPAYMVGKNVRDYFNKKDLGYDDKDSEINEQIDDAKKSDESSKKSPPKRE